MSLRVVGVRRTLEEVAEGAFIDGMQVWTLGRFAPARYVFLGTGLVAVAWWMHLLPGVLLFVAWAFGVFRGVRTVRRERTLRIDACGVHLDGVLETSREALGVAWRPSADDPNHVRIAQGPSRWALDIEAPDAESATRILAALGALRGRPRRTVFAGAHAAYPEAWVTISLAALGWALASVLPFVRLAPQVGGLACVVVGLLLIPYIRRVHVAIGSDGVFLSGSHLRRFIAHADVEKVVASKGTVTIHLHSGPPVSIRFPTSEEGTANELQSCILETRQMRNPVADGAGEAHALLARGGRDIRTWMDATAALTEGGADRYRIASLAPEVLWEKVEDGATQPVVRIGAALALRPLLDEEGRERLRFASQTSVAPDVRAAFEAVADADDDVALEAKLARRADA